MRNPQWKTPPVLIKVLEAQRLMKLAQKTELEQKLAAADRLLKQQIALLNKVNNDRR